MREPALDRTHTAQHEAGHICGMILFSQVLPKLTRADWPDERSYGWTKYPWDDTGRNSRRRLEFMVAVLLGPLGAKEADWPPNWPLNRGALGDERQLAAAASLLQMDEGEWGQVVEVAIGTTKTRVWTRLHGLVARALEINETLTDRDLRILLGPDRLDELGIAPPPNELTNDEQE